jgi:hypothetical protein
MDSDSDHISSTQERWAHTQERWAHEREAPAGWAPLAYRDLAQALFRCDQFALQTGGAPVFTQARDALVAVLRTLSPYRPADEDLRDEADVGRAERQGSESDNQLAATLHSHGL